MTRNEIKTAADNARETASDALETFNAACRAYNTIPHPIHITERIAKMRAAEDVYRTACKVRADAEYNEQAIERDWPLR